MSDDLMGYSVVLFFVWLVCGCIAGAIATTKQRSGIGWFFLGVLFGPLAILFIAVASRGDAVMHDANGASSVPGPTSTASEIERLAALRDQGDLTEEEFSAAKSKLLA